MNLIKATWIAGICLFKPLYNAVMIPVAYPIGPDAVQLECSYKIIFKPDSLAPEVQFDYYTLKIGKNTSYYTSKKNLAVDSLLNIYTALPFTQETAHEMTSKLRELSPPKSTFSVYKDRKGTKIWFFDKVSTTKYFYEEPTNEFKWTIQPGTAVIAGYDCEKATISFAGRRYEAWFTRKIPVSDGPHKFTGLPGLITKIHDVGNNYSFELTGITKPIKPIFINPPLEAACVRTTKVELRQGQRDYRQNGIKQLASSGAMVIQGKSLEDTKPTIKRTNPLELK